MSAPYFLIDTDTTNLVGSYGSEEAALRAVAEAAHRYGRDSEAVTSLALLRDDVPEHEACVASGKALVSLALERIGDHAGRDATAGATDNTARRGARRPPPDRRTRKATWKA